MDKKSYKFFCYPFVKNVFAFYLPPCGAYLDYSSWKIRAVNKIVESLYKFRFKTANKFYNILNELSTQCRREIDEGSWFKRRGTIPPHNYNIEAGTTDIRHTIKDNRGRIRSSIEALFSFSLFSLDPPSWGPATHQEPKEGSILGGLDPDSFTGNEVEGGGSSYSYSFS